jgi:cell wall-associated NlpC family hydrolase
MRIGRLVVVLALLATLTSCSLGSAIKNIDLAGNLCGTSGTDAGITPEQNANAKAIADVALRLGLGLRGVEVGVVVAMTEATLINVGFGDTMANGQMSSSRGLFQQLDAWGPLADRTDPTKAAVMFYTGGERGQKGLMDIPGWETMPIPQAAQAVEQSQFTDGSNYAKNLEVGKRIAASVTGGGATCSPITNDTVLASGVNVPVPSNQFVVPEELRGKNIQAPTAEVAKGLAAGFSKLGLPYVWGGGGSGAGEDNGCGRGGGALNSCGSEIGFDCSGLTAYVMMQGTGKMIPGDSGSQRSGGTDIPWNQGLAGDIIGFNGHVAMFLGFIDGQPYILEASQVGTPIHIVKLTRTGHDAAMHRYWDGAQRQ